MDPVSQFIEVVALHFPSPKFGDPSEKLAWVSSWMRMLGQYTPETLAKAADHIIRTRDRKKDGAFFPTPKEVIQACEDAKRVVEMRKVPLLAGPQAPQGFDPARHQLALDLLGTPLGVEAVKGRWHGMLYAFAYRYARLPKGTEIDKLKQEAAAVERDVEALERGDVKVGPGLSVGSLAKLGRHVLGRRDKIKAAVAAK